MTETPRLLVEIDAPHRAVAEALDGWWDERESPPPALTPLEGERTAATLAPPAASLDDAAAGRAAARARWLLQALRARAEGGIDLGAFGTSGLFYPRAVGIESAILAPPGRVHRALLARTEHVFRVWPGGLRAVRPLADLGEVTVVEIRVERAGAGARVRFVQSGFSPIEEWWTLEERVRLLPGFVLAARAEEDRANELLAAVREELEGAAVLREDASIEAPPAAAYAAIAAALPALGWRAIEADPPRRVVCARARPAEEGDGLVEIAFEERQSGAATALYLVETGRPARPRPGRTCSPACARATTRSRRSRPCPSRRRPRPRAMAAAIDRARACRPRCPSRPPPLRA